MQEQADFKKYLIERSRDPGEVPDARQRALMACLVIPNEIQKLMVAANAIEPLLDSIEATIKAAERHAVANQQ